MEAFWPEQPAASVRRRLNTLLWRLRRFIGECHLHCSDAGLVSLTESVQCDAVDFVRLQDSSETWHRALDGYGGELLPGCYDEWIIRERERLRGLRSGLLRRLVTEFEQRGEIELALHAATELSCAEPLREDVHRLLMRLYTRAGRRVEALRQFDSCAEVLAAELGIEPMPETTLLAADIRMGMDFSDLRERSLEGALAELREALAGCRASAQRLERVVTQIEASVAGR
jgi:DNA-binding SARP family transcriptional activator